MEHKTGNKRKESFLGVPCSMLHVSSRRGFILLFAVLVGSLLFSLGLAIAHISIKEVVISTAGKESEYAFFAADTGIECALYWDINVGSSAVVFPSSSNDVGRSTLTCNGTAAVPVLLLAESSTAATSTFTLNFTPSGCVKVVVGKTVSGSTVLESRGRNDCGTAVNPARVERALRVKY